MTTETKPEPHGRGTCIYCRLPVIREFPDSPWKTPREGAWRCASNPRAGKSTLTWHKVA